LHAVPPEQNSQYATNLEQQGFHLRITRDLETAKDYLMQRYAENLLM